MEKDDETGTEIVGFWSIGFERAQDAEKAAHGPSERKFSSSTRFPSENK